MAYDRDNHELHPFTGFMVDNRTGAPAGLLPVPHPVSEASDFPKWVTPHPSHIHRRDAKSGAPLHVSVPMFPNFHVGRDGAVTVLVTDDEFEKFALAEKGSMEMPETLWPEMKKGGFVFHTASEAYPWGWWGPKEAMEPTPMPADAPILYGDGDEIPVPEADKQPMAAEPMNSPTPTDAPVLSVDLALIPAPDEADKQVIEAGDGDEPAKESFAQNGKKRKS